ncbi:MAG: endonuclease/exonuclease/phosphatase family protein [Bacteroidota bacterium]
MKKRYPGIIVPILKITAIILLTALITGLFSRFINPYYFWPAAFLSLAFPAIWMLTIITALLLFRIKWWFFVLIISVLAASPLMLRHFTFPFFHQKNKTSEYLIMTFNVHGFAGIRSGKSSYERQALVHEIINDLDPAVVCMQEYPLKSRKHARYLDHLNKELELEYKHISDFNAESKGTSYTFITATRYPVKQRGTVFTMDPEICGIFTDIEFPEGMVRVYNIHLQSVKLIGEKKLLRPHRNPGAIKYFFTYLKGTISKLRKAFPARSYQARMIEQSIRTCPYPVIIAGDFNDTPASFSYNVLRKGMEDAAFNQGSGFNRTYSESLYPIRIDHIFIDKSLKMGSYDKMKIYLSDHFPVVAGFGFKAAR